MTHCELASRPLLQCLRHTYGKALLVTHFTAIRAFSSTPITKDEAQSETPRSQPFYRAPNPALVTSPRLERRLVRAGNHPIGSRRRRAALQDSPNIPFELLPYQCFQEARKVLFEDREEKLKQIETERGRIARLRAADPSTVGGELRKNNRLRSMEKHLEHLKILADINDPVIKKRFEDGLGDMNRPIYRYLADQKWREYRRKIIVQRITQMKVIPDVLPHLDPIVDVKLAFGRRAIPPGEFVDSRVSSMPAKLNVQTFEHGEKLLTVAVVDLDVPDPEHDSFGFRCHFLAINVPISPTESRISLDKLSTDNQVIFPWLPPYAQKGSPYHRLSIVILEQKDQAALDLKQVAEKVQRDDFRLRSLQTRHQLKPIGVHLFRSKWDENTESVMKEFGIPGAEIEFRRKRIEPLPYKRRNPSSFR
ncbi:ribosomal protein YmL35 [Histoplasma capsulatum var. duboisii H88]|uniref:Large ribosomal subunit protein mL38 n=2 Tax=Ajellomyces capsulatus TaxID=5037 RepID=F0UH90_AJEC8|nr:ribosomal protein YmL35 [Histoplasma capsulatum H143]EGC44437.1 ribosomal protein YmL35 [Histoplasma capsulatum var. duboisii H88]QSS55211.1 ribosomal protein YmL35 [Histoplasma capsulatum var. duboisii H88]